MSKLTPEKADAQLEDSRKRDSRKQPVVRIATGGYHPDTGFQLFDGPVVTGGFGETVRDIIEGENRNSCTETPGGGEKSPSR